MLVNNPYGSKERLFEVFNIVNNLNEAVLDNNKKNEIINRFIQETLDYLGVDDDDIVITISQDPTEAAEMCSFGKYTPSNGELRVVALNRNLGDVLRTLAHELVHYKQFKEDRLYEGAGGDGSEIENEANAEAAIIMRRFGKENPIIFE